MANSCTKAEIWYIYSYKMQLTLMVPRLKASFIKGTSLKHIDNCEIDELKRFTFTLTAALVQTFVLCV